MRAYVHVQRWGVTGDGLDPLINRIARNLLIDRHRRAAPHLVSLDAAEEVQDPALDTDEQVLRRQRHVEVRSAVSELPERHRTAILYSLKGMTPAEVGDKLGIGRNAADALLHRARRSLRERLRHVGEGMLGFGFWVTHKMRSGARRAGLDGTLAVGSVAVDSGAALVAAAALVATLGFGGGAGGNLVGFPSSPLSAKSTVAQTTSSGSVTPDVAGPAALQPGGSGGSFHVGPASTEFGGPGNGHYVPPSNTKVTDPVDPDREILGVAPDVFQQQDGQTSGIATQACAMADDCSVLYQDPTRP